MEIFWDIFQYFQNTSKKFGLEFVFSNAAANL